MYQGNFKFMLLNSCCSDIIEYLINAEQSVYTESMVTTVNILSFAEIIVKKIYNHYSFKINNNWSLMDMLNNEKFKELINRSILQNLYEIDKIGNYLLEYVDDLDDDYKEEHALQMLKTSYVIAYWYYCSFNFGEKIYDDFKEPLFCCNFDEDTIEEMLLKYKSIQDNCTYKFNNNVKLTQGEFKIQNNEVAQIMGFEKDEILLNDIFKEYELTTSQERAIDKLDDFLQDKDQKIFLLKGYGGTGKTFLTKGLTDYLNNSKINFILAAPTGKAAKVIQNKTNQSACTIHKAIYQFKDLIDDLKDKDVETYKFYFNVDENSVQPSNTIFIIDESSMISDNYSKNEFFNFGSGKLLSDLLKFTNISDDKFNNKIIFIGDTAQLPPVGMNRSPALDPDYFKEKLDFTVDSCELTDVVRQQQESGILINSLKLREKIQSKSWQSGTTYEIDCNYSDISSISEENLIDKYLEFYRQSDDNAVIIAHNNQTVDDYNRMVRKQIFPNNCYATIGDKVMAIENYRDPNYSIFNGDYGRILSVDDEFIQRDIKLTTTIDDEKITTTIPLRFKKMEIEFSDTNKSFTIETIIFENTLDRDLVYDNTSFGDDIKKYVLSNNDIGKIEKLALYLDVLRRAKKVGIKSNTKDFKKFIAEDIYFNSLKIKFGYAITCHKAQGSEWKNVFLNTKAHNKFTKDYLRWLYTAITRSSKNLYIINS